MKGTVKWFNEKKGFGFIVPEGGGQELFVHYSGITGEGFRLLSEGQAVEFDVKGGAKGQQAFNVKQLR